MHPYQVLSATAGQHYLGFRFAPVLKPMPGCTTPALKDFVRAVGNGLLDPSRLFSCGNGHDRNLFVGSCELMTRLRCPPPAYPGLRGIVMVMRLITSPGDANHSEETLVQPS
jgi:hypothetical protein